MLTEELGYMDGVHASAVDDITSADGFFAVCEIVDAAGSGSIGDFKIEVEIDTVGNGIVSRGDGDAVGTGNGSGGSPEGAGGFGRDVRFHAAQLFLTDYAQSGNAVCDAAVVEFTECFEVAVAESDNVGADFLAFHTKLFTQFLHQFIAAHIELRLECARLCIVSGMDNRGIGAGSTHSDIASGFDNSNFAFLCREIPCGHHTGTAGADNDYII